MRRWLSCALVLLFGLWPLTGTLEASDDSRLPACCRRHGAHHCAMAMQMAAMMAQQASSATPMLAAPLTCPMFPGSLGGASIPAHALAAAAVELQGPTVQPFSPAGGRMGVRSQPACTRAGRGPPATSLS